MSLTIYTVSDPATVGSAMSAMAMFFGQDGWVGTAIKTGLLFSLLFVVAQGITQRGLRLDMLVVQLIVMWVMFMPKTTVTIEQFDNAAPPRVVDDVPYAIALPGSLAGAFALYMTQKIEAVMVNVNGDYLAVSGESHPFTPARVLMAVTLCPSDPMSCADANLVETMRLAARYCSDGTLSTADFKIERDVLDKFAKTMTNAAQTQIFDASNPYIPGGGGGRTVTCAEAATYLQTVSADEMAGTGGISKAMNGLANRAEVKRYNANARAADNTERSWDDAIKDMNKFRDSASKLDSLAFANVTLYSLADSLKYAANAPIDQVITLRRDTALFDWAKSESQTSMLVSSTAPKFMDILFFVFIASTPIVMFVVAANPSGGLKVAGAYVLFGMWTQSWIPMMAIIMSWYQNEVMNIASPVNNAFTPEYMAFFMRHVYTSTIAASNMIQQAPYLMFAIMTGSMFALSGIVSKSAPSGGGGRSGGASSLLDGSSAGGGSGDVLNPGPKGGIPASALKTAMLGGQSVMSGGGMMTPSAAMVGDASGVSMSSLNASSAINAASGMAQERISSLQQALSASQSKAMESAVSTLTQAAHTLGGERFAQVMNDAGFRTSFDKSTGTVTTQGGSFKVSGSATDKHAASAALKGALQANSRDSLPGMLAAAGTGLSAALSAEAGISMAREQASTIGHENTAANNKDASTRNGVSETSGTTAGKGVRSSTADQYQQASGESKKMADTFQQIAQQTKALSDASKLTQNATAAMGATTAQNISGADVATKWGQGATDRYGAGAGTAGEALGRVASFVTPGLSAAQSSQFTQDASARMNEMDKSPLYAGMGNDQKAAIAAWNTLSDMSAKATSPEAKMNAQMAMASLAKGANAGDVTAPLQAAQDALKAVSGVAGNIQKMESEVKPAVQQAVAQASQALGPEASSTFTADVRARQQKVRGAVGGAQAEANAGPQKVQSGAEAARNEPKFAGAFSSANSIDTQGLVDKRQQDQRFMSAYPTGSNNTQYGLGNDASVSTFFTNPNPPMNPAGVGPEGAPGLRPDGNLATAGAKLLDSVTGAATGVVNSAQAVAAALTPESVTGAAQGVATAAQSVASPPATPPLSGAIQGMVNAAQSVASAPAPAAVAGATSGVLNAAQSVAATPTPIAGATTTTMIVAGSTPGAPSLPTLGGGSANQLSTPGGGGASPPPTPVAPSTSKPSAKGASTSGGNPPQKPKTPGR
jgi:hypothetical protein